MIRPGGAAMTHSKHPIDGMWLHVMKADRIERQGVVVGVDGEHALVQWYSWMTGEPTFVESKLTSDLLQAGACRFYRYVETWLDAADMQTKRDVRDIEAMPERAWRNRSESTDGPDSCGVDVRVSDAVGEGGGA